MSDPVLKSSEADKDEEEWKCERRLGQKNGGIATEPFPARTLLDCSTEKSSKTTEKKPVLSPLSTESLLDNVCMNGEKSGSGGGGGGKSVEAGKESRPAVSSSSIRLPTAAKGTSRNRKEAGIPVGIAVVWQRLAPAASTTPPLNSTACNTMSSTKSISPPLLVKSTPKIKTPGHSPVPKRPSSTSSAVGGGTKEKIREKWGNTNDSAMMTTDVKCRPSPAQSVPLNPYGMMTSSKLSEQHSPHPYGGSLKYTTDWLATGLNVPTSLSSQNYNAAAAAYLHHQHQLQQHQQHLQQQHHLQQQQQLQQLHHMSHASHHFGAHPATQSLYAGYSTPDVLHKYEQYLFQHQAELARQQELQYHHHLHQLHNLSQQQQQQQLHPEYDIHRATPIPSPRINIPSPSPTLHGVHHPHVTPTTTAASWSPEILYHHTSATLSPKSLASTPSPVSAHDSSFLCNPPKANLSAKATTTRTVVPHGASSTSPPVSRAATTTDWKDVKINPVPKKVAMSWTTTTVIKKNEKLDSPPVMEGDAVHSDSGKEKSITKKKHDFTRLESLIEKRDDVTLLSPVPIKIDTECAGNESKPSVPNSHQLQPITTGPDYLSNSSCGRSEWPTGIGGSAVDLKPLMNNDPVKIKRETENCDVPLKIAVVTDGVSNLVPEMKIKSHVIKCESVSSVADSSVNKSAQVLPTATTKAEPVGAGSLLITNEKKPKKLHSQELKNPQRPVCFAKHNGVNNNNDNANSNNSSKLVKEPILTKSFKQEKNTSPIMMIIPGAGPMTVADSHQNNNSSSSSSSSNNSNDSNYNDSHPMMSKQDKTNSKFERNSVTSTVTTPLSQPLEQKCDFQSQSPPLTKCDTDIKIVAPHSLSYSLINKNNNNSDTINDTSRPRKGDAENGCRRRRRDGDDDHDDEYQEQKIIGNICTTNRSNYHHLVNVPLNQSPHSSLLASSSVCKKIKSENVGDISSATICTADDRDTLSRFHHQDNNPPPDYRPIIVQAADSSNHLDLLATVAQQFGNEIGLRKKPFTTTTTVSTVSSATKAFDDEYEFKEESSVPDRNSNKMLEPCGPFSAMNDDDEDDADEESLPSLPNSRPSSPFLTTPISSILAKFPLVKSGQAPPPPTVAPLVLRIPQVSPGDTSSSVAAATGTEKKLKKPKSKRNKKDNENKSGHLLGMVKKKKKKKSSSKPGQDKPKLKRGSKANENLLTVTSSSSSLGSSDRAEKAMKKSKKENVDELWQLGELKVAPLKLTKRRSTSDAIVMKKGTGSLVSRDKIKKQRYSIESTAIPCIWSSSPETGMRADAKLDKHSSTKAVDSKKQPSHHTKTPGLLAMGQSSRIIQKKKKKSKKQAEDEDRKKPTSSSLLLSEQPNTLSQDLSKKKKKKSKNHPDLSCNFHNNLGPSASVGSGEEAGCDNERDDDNDTFEPGQEVFSPASSNVENDWAANPTYAVTAIKTLCTAVTDSTPILAPSNTDDNSKKISHPQQQEKKLKASKLTPANLNNVESAEGTGGGKLQKNLNKSYIKSSPSLVQEVTPSKKTKQQSGHHHIKPSLKAEPIRRSSTSPQNDFISSEDDEKDTDENIDISTKYSSDTQIEPVVKEKVVEKSVKIESVDEMINDMRVLTEIQGLFYTGKLNALQPPDVYGVTLDNERGAPPHIIFSAEEVLEKCIRELKPEPEALVHGLRICAYWSPQYSGLYPGKISPDYIPSGDPYNELIPIEFDDGDTGVIKLNEIRLLSPDHPKGEYDPNPLLTLEKKHRKRRHSSAAGSQTSGCTGDHEEADCGEPYCAKIGKLEEDEGGKSKSKLLYWTWKGLSLKKNNRSKKDRNKDFFEGIQRGDEVISVGDSALFTSSGNDRPFIGRVEKFWEKKGQKIVKVRWYYHPDEVKTNKSMKGLYAGSLFESPHIDENDVQTIAKKCEVLPFAEFKERVGCLTKWSRNTSQRGIYFVSGFYNPYTYNLQLKDLK